MKTRLTAAGAFLMVLGSSSLAFAAGGDLSDLNKIAIVINFLLFAGLVTYFAGGKIKAHFAARRQLILDQIAASQRLHEEAQATLASYKEKISAFDREREEILAEFRAAGEAERARIVADAETQAGRILRDAEQLAEREQRMARTGLEQRLVDRAVAVAVEELGRQLNPMTQSRLIDQGIERLRSTEASGGASHV